MEKKKRFCILLSTISTDKAIVQIEMTIHAYKNELEWNFFELKIMGARIQTITKYALANKQKKKRTIFTDNETA